MDRDWLPFMELLIVLAFGAGWAVLEWQGRRLDRRQREREAAENAAGASAAAEESAESADREPR